MPRLYVTPNPQPNAFATGRNPKSAAVAVTEGLLQALTWDEIRGVLAHELAHVRNRDILTGSVAAAIASFITFAARMAAFGAMFGGMGGSNDDHDRNPIGELLLMVLGPIAAMVIQMAISRSREFAADASAAKLIGTGEPLASALSKLNSYGHTSRRGEPGTGAGVHRQSASRWRPASDVFDAPAGRGANPPTS